MAVMPRHTVLLRTLVFVVAGDQVLLIRYRDPGIRFGDSGDSEAGEKSGRSGIYNGIGGHVEKGEDILAGAAREALEEAGVRLESPRLAGVVHVDGFAGKQILNCVVIGSTSDFPKSECDEGEIEWVKISRLPEIRAFADVKPLLERSLESADTFTGTAEFNGFDLVNLILH
jgi:8-oxo-dGTP diphosphatase